ncbi:MAG TPA: M56 family metallopeptidase [Verrucomicrobiae bacterium]|jgi:beta-lactamase regulating signal transducer with metallopeptidase domain|nr:M56 family metallopeptidase [Verrucomicrobiae bacterium]
MNAEFFTACERLLSAAANGVYQGTLIAAVTGVALRLLPRTNAATRHAVWFGILLFVAALIPAHVVLSSQPPAQTLPIATQPTAVISSESEAIPLPDPKPAEDQAADNDYIPSAPLDAPDSPLAHSNTTLVQKAWSFFAQTNLKPMQTAIRLPHSICLALISAWALLASFRAALVGAQIIAVRRAKKMSSVPSHPMQTLFATLRDSLTARRNVQLRISTMHRTAVVLGFVHPVVLLPAEMDSEADGGEVEHVLRHELAHVARRDDWGNLVQQLIEAALFFHPAVWWISTRLSLDREIACDDYVLEASGSPRAYALTLANMAGRMNHRRPLLAPGVSNNKSQLKQRITMILNAQRDRSPRLAKSRLGLFTTAAALLAVLAIVAGPRLVLAQAPDTTQPQAATADGSPAALPPDSSGAESGPRSKSASSESDSAPSIPTPELPPAPSAATVLVAPPAPPTGRHHRKDMSVEERLDRIEHMLAELQATRDKVKAHQPGVNGLSLVVPGGPQIEIDGEAFGRAKRNFDYAMRDFGKNTEDFEKMQDTMREMQAKAPDMQLQILRSTRDSLQKQIQAIDRHLKQINEELARPKKLSEDRPDNSDAGSKE